MKLMKSFRATTATLGLFLFIFAGCECIITTPLNNQMNNQVSTPAASNLPLAELKYRLIEKFGGEGAEKGILTCDPDFYPSGSLGREQEQALKLFPTISQDVDTFQVILSHLKMEAVTTFTPEQKLSIYREFKKLNAVPLEPVTSGYKFHFAYKDVSGEFHIEGTISPKGDITTQQNTEMATEIYTCPICLVGNTLIDTPNGPIAVKDLQVGMTVWTMDHQGNRNAAPIIKTAHVRVPLGHLVIHLQLSDGRELFASPSHPTADGRIIVNLFVGNQLDGATIIGVQRLAYPDEATYDLLPAGNTGFYWANGILMGSTLAPR